MLIKVFYQLDSRGCSSAEEEEEEQQVLIPRVSTLRRNVNNPTKWMKTHRESEEINWIIIRCFPPSEGSEAMIWGASDPLQAPVCLGQSGRSSSGWNTVRSRHTLIHSSIHLFICSSRDALPLSASVLLSAVVLSSNSVGQTESLTSLTHLYLTNIMAVILSIVSICQHAKSHTRTNVYATSVAVKWLYFMFISPTVS